MRDGIRETPRELTDDSNYHGHMTMADGSHVALTADEAKALWEASEAAQAKSEADFPDEQAVREWAEGLKTQVFEANKRAVLAERKVLENSKARLADAPSKSPDTDLSSLRKGAEVMREAIEDAVEKLNTYRGAAVQTVIDQLEAALVSGSREDGE